MSEPPRHLLSPSDFDALANGSGSVDAILSLIRGQFSKWVLTLGSLIDSVGHEPLEEALQLLIAAEEAKPETFVEVVTSPMILAWAQLCLDATMGSPSNDVSDIEYLRCVASTAAMRAGIDFSISVPLRNGAVFLPTLGKAVFGPEFGTTASIRSVNGETVITARDAVGNDSQIVLTDDDTRWLPIRMVHLVHNDLALTVAIDDVDPNRYLWKSLGECADRLSDEQFKMWKDTLVSAWEFIVEHHRSQAEGMSAGLRVIVPVEHPWLKLADVWPRAFGAISITGPSEVGWLTHCLLNAFQCDKLQALQDLLPLHHAVHDEYRYFAPWWYSPCSLRQIFEGLYTHPVIASYWNVQRELLLDPVEKVDAALQFARWHNRTLHMQDVLADSGEITEWGWRILQGVQDAIHKLQVESVVSDDIQKLARFVENDFRSSWRVRNLTPDHQSISRLANAWTASVPSPLNIAIKLFVRETPLLVGYSSRLRLGVLGLANLSSDRSEAANETRQMNQEMLLREVPAATNADIQFMSDDAEAARDLYLAAIQNDPYDREAWVGLALSCPEGNGSAAQAFARYPEVVRATYIELAVTHACFVDPFELAAWLSPLCVALGDLSFTLE